MLVIEQVILPHSRASHGDLILQNVKGSVPILEFDADAEIGGQDEGPRGTGYQHTPHTDSPIPNASHDEGDATGGAIPLTFGLVVHGLADGLALGVSSLPTNTLTNAGGSKLRFIVFLALLVHKGQ